MVQRNVCFAVGTAMLCCVAAAVPAHGADATSAALAVVRLAGTDGVDSQSIATAWAQLARSDAAALPTLLGALNDAPAPAANWLRSATDAIVDRELGRGGTLPVTEIEAFVRDTSHDARARRVAFGYLTRVDLGTPDRLIPTMLHDAGATFRYEAVARLLAEAAPHFDAERKDEARRLYRKAMTGAVDPIQVKLIAERLAKLDVPVDLPSQFGFVMEWKLIGPFEHGDPPGFDTVFPPEKKINLGASYPGKIEPVAWIDGVSSDDYGLVDIKKLIGRHKNAVAYGLAEFTSTQRRPVELRIGTYNAMKVWLNDKLLFAHEEYHHGSAVDQYRIQGVLEPGRNRILVKVCQNDQKEDWAQNWQFQLRVCDATGAAVLSTTRPPRRARNATGDKGADQ